MPVMENATWNNEMWVNRKEFYYVIFAIIIPLYIHLLGRVSAGNATRERNDGDVVTFLWTLHSLSLSNLPERLNEARE